MDKHIQTRIIERAMLQKAVRGGIPIMELLRLLKQNKSNKQNKETKV